MNMGLYILVLCWLNLIGSLFWLLLRLWPGSPTAKALGSADALILGDIDNPLVKITPAHFSSPQALPIDVDPSMRSALEPLLQRAPELFRLGRDASTRTYRLVFSPAVTQALNNGTMELVPSAGQLLPVARRVGSTKFIKQGRVIAQGGVRLANIAAASWQIAAMVTAQHFLSEINARLAGIERGIEDIRTWLEEEKKGELRAAVIQLREYANAISRRSLNEQERAAMYHQLDAIEFTCLSIGELAREMSRRRLEELDRLEVNEWMDRSGSTERAIKWVKHNREALELIFLAQSVRIVGCHVKLMLPGDRQRVTERIVHALGEAANAQRLFDETRHSLLAKVKELGERSGDWTALWGVFDDDHRRRIESEFSCVGKQALVAVEKLKGEATGTRDLSSRVEQFTSSGLALDVHVDEKGEVQILSVTAASA